MIDQIANIGFGTALQKLEYVSGLTGPYLNW